MDRRGCLAAVCSLLPVSSGCLAIADPDGESDEAESNTETHPNMISELAVEDVTGAEDEPAIEFGVDAIRSEITEAETARVRLTYANTSDEEAEASVRDGDAYQLAPRWSEEDDGLLLLPDRFEATRVEPGCWKPEQERFGATSVQVVRTLEPGRTISQEYEVWLDPERRDCAMSGEYHFETGHGSFTLVLG